MLKRVFFLLTLVSVCLAAPVKLAIVESSPAVAETAALLTASLSKTNSLLLLERSEVERILREQSLATDQLTNVLRASRILGADGLIILDGASSQGGLEMQLRMATVKEGAALLHIRATVAAANLQQWIDSVAAQITAIAPKIGADRGEVVSISVFNLRSPSASSASQLLDRELTSLLLLRFGRQTNFLLLERRKLLDLALEKDLSAQAEQFWSGAYVLDGVVNKDGFSSETVTVSLLLTAPDKSVTTLEAAGARTNLAAIVEDLLNSTLRSLKLRKTAAWDPAREAQALADEAAWNLRWKMFPEAQAAGDSAWALGSRSPALAATRALSYAREYPEQFGGSGMGVIMWIYYPPRPERLQSLTRSAAILDEAITRERGILKQPEIFDAVDTVLSMSGGLLFKYYYLVEAREGFEDSLADLRRFCRNIEASARACPEIRLTFWGPPQPAPLPAQRPPLPGETLAQQLLHYCSMFYEKPEDLLEVYRDLMAAEHFPNLLRKTTDYRDTPIFGGWKWSDRRRAESVHDSFIHELISSTNVFLSLEGRLLELHRDRDWYGFEGKIESLLGFLEKNFAVLETRQAVSGLRDFSATTYFSGGVERDELLGIDKKIEAWFSNHGIERFRPQKAEARPALPKTASARSLRSSPVMVTNIWTVKGLPSLKSEL